MIRNYTEAALVVAPVAFRLFCDTNLAPVLPSGATTLRALATLANVGWGQIVRAQGEGGKMICVAAAS